MVTLSPPRAAVPEGGLSDGSSSEHAPMITSTTSSGGGGGGGSSVRRLCLSPRKRALAAAAVIVAVAGVGIALSGLQQDPFGQCDRQCRAAYGFYDRSITGARRGALGDSCACSRAGEPLGEEQPWRSHTPWNESFWCDDFSTALVCVAAAEGERTPRTMSRADAELAGRTVLHCGACAACSTLHDLQVLNSSKEYATLRITKCATAYAKPKWLGGHRDVAKLRTCMREAEVGFSEDGAAAWAQPADQATCMDCWTDNIACDAVACVTNPDCIRRFFDPAGTEFSGCIKCDEINCGPAFIRCAGANRRSSGILSDITRPGPQVCPVGFWSPK